MAYLILFMLAVFSPSLVTRDYFGVHETHVEEFLIFVFGFTGIAIFMFYEKLMEKKEKENQEIMDACEQAKKELVSSYQYIGSVNRQLDLLKKLINDTSVSMYEQAKLSKDLLHSLASAASVSFGGAPALLRFVHLDKLRTEGEFHFPNHKDNNNWRIANKELKRVHEENRISSFVNEGESLILVPSDQRSGSLKAFLIVKDIDNRSKDFDPSVLKVFVNQAELVFRDLRQVDKNEADSPLGHVEAVAREVKGEID